MAVIMKKELGVNINRFEHALRRSDATEDDIIRHVYYVIKSFGEV